MKLLKITAEGLPLFKEKLDLTFYAQQRVNEDDKEVLYPLFSSIYLNPANGFIGINASGKTSVLKVILVILNMLNNEPLNHIEGIDILGDAKTVVFNSFFYAEENQEIGRLETVVISRKTVTDDRQYSIISEKLWLKKAAETITRKEIVNFTGKTPVIIRNEQEEFLSEDVSIMIAYNKKIKEHINVANLLLFTNINVFPFPLDISPEVITFLDPTVEKLSIKKKNEKSMTYLKFKNKKEIVLDNPIELSSYLSSGTIKGMIVFTLAKMLLQTGGYLIVDELENHFNKEIAATLMRFFMNSKLNKNGAVLLFSTHYPELLDEYERNDSIFITRNQDGIFVENLCHILNRNDMKKSDVYQSGFLKGTTPIYEAYMELKKAMAVIGSIYRY